MLNILLVVQSLVTHNMVIGSRYDAEDLGALRKLGISYVLNMTDRIPNYFPDVLIYHKIEIQGILFQSFCFLFLTAAILFP